jgi:hypothetical protein
MHKPQFHAELIRQGILLPEFAHLPRADRGMDGGQGPGGVRAGRAAPPRRDTVRAGGARAGSAALRVSARGNPAEAPRRWSTRQRPTNRGRMTLTQTGALCDSYPRYLGGTARQRRCHRSPGDGGRGWAVLRRLTARLLLEAGYAVHEAKDGLGARLRSGGARRRGSDGESPRGRPQRDDRRFHPRAPLAAATP